MRKNKKNISGVTLVEILIGIVITTIIMGAIYTTYSVVNKTYSQVSEKAGISESSRDLVSMLIRDVRMAGFKYYVGTHVKERFASDTSGQCDGGILLPSISYFGFNNGFENPDDSHNPIVIRKQTISQDDRALASDTCCDSIEVVYEDFNINDVTQPFKKYKIIYFAERSENEGRGYAVYKTIQEWSQPREAGCEWPLPTAGSWQPETPQKELIREYVVDMEFIPFDENGLIVQDVDGNYPDPGQAGRVDQNGNDIRNRLQDIRGVDIRLTFMSKENFFDRVRPNKRKPKQLLSARVSDTLDNTQGQDTADQTDLKLRDSVLVTVNTRNLGGDLFQ